MLGPLIDHDPKKSTSDGPSSTRLQAAKARKDEDLRPWIENMKSWMRQKKAETERLLDLTRIDTEVKQSSEYVLGHFYFVLELISSQGGAHERCLYRFC